jgi:hypothetical protein
MTRILSLLALAPALACATPLLNGGFEDPVVPPGTFGPIVPTGWLEGGVPGAGLFLESYSAFSLPTLGGEGVQAAGFGASGNSGQWLAQTFDTIAGHMYQVSFQYLVQQGPLGGGFNEEWTFDALNGATVLFDQSQVFSNTAWVTSTFVFAAVGSASTIRFTDNSGLLGTDHLSVNWALDAVNVTDLSTPAGVPEPAAVALTGAGLAALGLIRRRAHGRRKTPGRHDH